ncbi:hypothetical protein V7S43_004383 [Phytophthora oleae]|uniref:Uncharacterized protein n=1 Tax=Phytophthora oleae TaxID=2107226 RepID=A0ABD3FSZ7_9STRA
MGGLIHKLTPDDMEGRFYYSGGSVREFTYATWEHIRRVMDNTISGVADYSKLLSDTSMRLTSEALLRIYTWAKNAGHGALAGCAFEIYLHRLASDNRLKLFKSEYDLPELRKPNQPRHFSVTQVTLSNGGAFCSGKSNDYERDLVAWGDDDMYTYWYPDCDNFPNIDSIVKLAPGPGRKSSVAYLQLTIARNHDIDGNQLKKMNEISFPDHVKNAGRTDAPIYIAVCPDKESCRKFVLD